MDQKEGAECEIDYTPYFVPLNDEVTKIMVPVYMYYFERYFLDVEDKTELDMEIGSILDESEEGLELLKRALSKYNTMPEEAKCKLFDPKTVKLASGIKEGLNHDLVRERIKSVKPEVVLNPEEPLPEYTPAAPSELVAKNNYHSEFTWHTIKLDWQDNSNNEDGFLIYRAFKGAGEATCGKFQLIKTVGPDVTTFVDELTKPTNSDDLYCYQVVAFQNSSIAPVGQHPGQLESSPSNIACSKYDVVVEICPDDDEDGVCNDFDECEGIKGVQPHGCFDKDNDWVHNGVDWCEEVAWPYDPMQKYPPLKKGCPPRYTLRWMGMEVLNNSGPYAFGQYKWPGLKNNEIHNDNGYGYGEEPYLNFLFLNGQIQGAKADASAQWCCGEGVDVKKGDFKEPDYDYYGEEEWGQDEDILDHGLKVWPDQGPDYIDVEYGLAMNVTLWERDYKAEIMPDEVEGGSDLEKSLKAGGKIAQAFITCAGTGGIGCVAGIATGVIGAIFGLDSSPDPIPVPDPDDFQGTNTWYITHYDAGRKTKMTGAYGFWFEMPTLYDITCLGWQPCYPEEGFTATMRAKVYFCLVREGVPESQIKNVCEPYTKLTYPTQYK